MRLRGRVHAASFSFWAGLVPLSFWLSSLQVPTNAGVGRMAINTEALVAGLERRLADEEAARKGLTTDPMTMYGIVGALLGWFILDPIAAVLGGVSGVLWAYSVYRLHS